MKTWNNIYRIIITLLVLLLWFCLSSRLEWEKDTRKALVQMMGFTAEGDEVLSKHRRVPSNETSPALELEECEWDEGQFAALPKSVQRYFHRAFLFTGEKEQFWEDCIKTIQSAICIEEGEILSNGVWMPYEATRYLSATPLHAGFVWDAKIKFSRRSFQLPYDIPYYVRDTYTNGIHDRTIKIFGALPIVHDVNKSQDDRAGFCWLAFSPIIPTSLLPRETLGVRWSIETKKRAHAWPFERNINNVAIAEYIDPEGIRSKAKMHFDSDGLIHNISTVGEDWQFHLSRYKSIGYGMLIPTYIQYGREEQGHFVPLMNVRIKDVKYTFYET